MLLFKRKDSNSVWCYCPLSFPKKSRHNCSDKDFPCTICDERINYLDTVHVLAKTAEAKDYIKSTYYCIDIVKVLGIKHSSEEEW